MLEVFLWILLTLLVASASAVVARRYGCEYIIGMYAAMAVTANVLASSKIVLFVRWPVDAGTVVYASIFLLTDMLSEFYGRETAKKAVWVGFMANVMLALSVWVAVQWAPAPFWKNQEAFRMLFSSTPRIVLASLIAYLASQHHDIWAYSFLKRLTGGRYLWLRNNISTMASQLIDTVIFTSVAFFGSYPIIRMMAGMYVVKMIVAALDTPFMYAARWYYYHRERKTA